MRVSRVGNNPGYGQGPQAEKANKDAPRKQNQQQPKKDGQPEEQDTVEFNPAAAKDAPRGNAGAKPTKQPPGGGRGPLDISG